MSTTVLIANRGEIAVRIIRTAKELGLQTVAVYPADDAQSLHVSIADCAVELPGRGAAAYLDSDAVIRAAMSHGATYVHPGYGFLAESPAFADACIAAGISFIGPDSDSLRIAGDKVATKQRASSLGISVPASTGVLTGPAEAHDLLSRHSNGILLKALAGGGGRGIAFVDSDVDLESVFARCTSEAEAGFGDGRLTAEAVFSDARHIEVQCLGTEDGAVAIGDRDCSLQRRRQKIVEAAPAPHLDPRVRDEIWAAAENLLNDLNYRSLATVEFLVADNEWILIEINPRIQVEHTITEMVTGLDLVALQFAVAFDWDPVEYGLPRDRTSRMASRGAAIQARIAAEYYSDDGQLQASVGTIEALDIPSGPGIRVDTWAQTGTVVSPNYDSLLAKLCVYSDFGLETAQRKLERTLDDFHIEGLNTSVPFLREVLSHVRVGEARTEEIDRSLPTLLKNVVQSSPTQVKGEAPDLAHGEIAVSSPLSGTIVSLLHDGDRLSVGEIGLIEAMKMHHPVVASSSVRSVRHFVSVGDTVAAGQTISAVRLDSNASEDALAHQVVSEHPGISEVQERHRTTEDSYRPEKVAKIHARGRRTARENLADLVDEGSFVEYGPLVIAAQRRRRSLEDLIANTTGDGIVAGIATIGAEEYGQQAAEVAVMSYDYMVMAGTQGHRNHLKTDRVLQVAAKKKIPVVLFAEGGGGRPGDTESPPGAHLDNTTFASFAALKDVVPLIAVVSGRCFAGNAALAGVCDVIIATEDANIGMSGPAMIEGGGLGKYAPEDIGPVEVHMANGVIDILAKDDAEAVQAVKTFLGYVQGTSTAFISPDHESARQIVPADRHRAFDMRSVITSMADVGSLTELRRGWAPGAITGFMRVEGHSVGVIANNNHHLGGAIDAEASQKFSEFIALANLYRIPIVSLIDTPGFMVGPEAEIEPGVKLFGQMFVAGAQSTVPFGCVVIRKGYGLGAMAMAAGGLRQPQFSIAWPAGEMGPMGLEGAVELGYRKELDSLASADERAKRYDELLEKEYDRGRAMTAAMLFDVDDVIDPADTRRWIETLF